MLRSLDQRLNTTRMIWKQEYQARGAVHYHIVFDAKNSDLDVLLDWCRDTWYRFGGGVTVDDHQHIEHHAAPLGTHRLLVEEVR